MFYFFLWFASTFMVNNNKYMETCTTNNMCECTIRELELVQWRKTEEFGEKANYLLFYSPFIYRP